MSNINAKAKLRSMPRRKTPSAVYIEMHQLANERERLQKELKNLGDRTLEVHQRLQELELNLNTLEAEVAGSNSKPIQPNDFIDGSDRQTSLPMPLNSKYQSLVIEY
jgi:predicted nuclease with TOPRIM domain